MRKTVKDYTRIRLETISTSEELNHLAFDLEASTYLLASFTPEQVRSDKSAEHRECLVACKKMHRDFGRQLKAHELAAAKLKSYF